jgi:hypothetical protein
MVLVWCTGVLLAMGTLGLVVVMERLLLMRDWRSVCVVRLGLVKRERQRIVMNLGLLKRLYFRDGT